MKKIISNQNKERMESLRYESFLNAVEGSFIKHKTGIRQVDRTMLKFTEDIVSKFAAIYANTRDDRLGEDAQKIIIHNKLNLN